MLPPDIERFMLLAETAQANLASASINPQKLQCCELLRWQLNEFARRLEDDKFKLCTKSCHEQEAVIQMLCAHVMLSENYSRRLETGDGECKLATLNLASVRSRLEVIYEELA